MTTSQIKEALKARGYSIRADRYLQKNLGNGWYVGVDTETNEVDAGHQSQLIQRGEHMCYEYNVSDHRGFKLDGITAVKNYVRNKEARKVPNHIIVGWAELLEYRLK